MKRKDKIKEIIKNSGNDFHLNIADFLSSRGWTVVISPYYNDPATNKPREIDIIATREINVRENFYNKRDSSFILRLFIECKHLPNSNVLWFMPKNTESAKELVIDNNVLRRADDGLLTNFSVRPPKTHHYLDEEKVMKLSAKTGNTDLLYEAMNSCLNALIFYKEHQHLNTANVIDLPVIVVNSFENLHKRNSENQDGYEDVTRNFQMEVDYSFSDKEGKPKTKYFLLDVVSGDKLEDFLRLLDECDVEILKNNLQEILFEQARSNSAYESHRRREDDAF